MMFKSVAFKFFLVLLGVLTLAFLVFGLWINNMIKNTQVEQVKTLMASFIQMHARELLEPRSFIFGSEQASQARFAYFFDAIQTSEVIRIKVWDTESRVIFSDDESIIGKTFPKNKELSEALNGHIEAEIDKPIKPENVSEAEYEEFLEIYIPIYFKENSRPVGVIETYLNLENLNVLLFKMRKFIIIAMIFAVAGFFMAIRLLSWFLIQKRLALLVQAAHKIAGGDLETRVIMKGGDEIGKLAADFNFMSAKLKESNEDLEQKVRDRTKDLENAKIAARNVLEDLLVEKENLAEAKAKDEAILNNIGEGVLAINPERKILFINKAGEDLLGWKEKDLLDKVVNSLPLVDIEGRPIPLEKRPTYIAMHEAKNVITNDYLFVRSDKTRFAIGINVAPIILKEKTVGAIIVFRNITKEKEIEKLRTDFLALASHQLRTPLSGTKWLIETMLRGVIGKMTLKQKEYLNQIYNSNERMIKLVFDMLNVLRLESAVPEVKKRTAALSEIFKDLLLRSETAAQARGVAIQCPADGIKLDITTDFESVKSILECFLSNAINYSHRGQTIIIDTKEEPGDFVFFVKDDGIGIPKDEQKKIFERFYRATNAKNWKPDGTGLGLYTSAMLAERIGAKISFESEENKGSIFYLRIPKKSNI